ncbi:MAG: hypothetical protein ACYCS4_13985 [Acidimicrobiales bacterium]
MVAVVAVGGVVAARVTSPSGPPGYLAANSSEALFVQMTRNGSQLAGTVSGAFISSSNPGQVETGHSSFTGIVSGSSVTLTFSNGLFGATNLTGTLNGSTLVLSGPGSGGSLVDFTFSASSVGAYNEAVAKLNKSAAAAYRKEQQQAAAAAAAQAQKKADQAVEAAGSTLSSDLSTLAQDATFTSQLASMSRALAKTHAALIVTQQKAQEVEALAQAHPNGDSGTVCYDAQSDVEYDAQSDVEYDAQSDVEYDAQSDVEPEIQTVQSDIAAVEHNLTKLQTAESNAPSYHPGGLPSPSSVQQAISNANANIQNAVNTTNSAISTANGYVAAAYQAADQAIAAGHCGGGLGTPPTVSPISANQS